jgi:outer membrane protein OmpA-like peptidoglycan-associated protein
MKALQEKVAAVQQAIIQTGVPVANIQVRSYSIFSPNEGIRYQLLPPSAPTRDSNTSSNPARPVPPPPAFTLSQNLDVRAPTDRINAITQAAVGAGASSVNITSNPFSPQPSTQPDLPDTTVYAEAVRKATEQAQAAAQATAQGSGLRLGSVRSISVQSPSYSFNSLEGGYWRIQVNVVYNVAPQ